MRDQKYLDALVDYKRLSIVDHKVSNCTSEVFNHFGTSNRFKGGKLEINKIVKNVNPIYGELIHYAKGKKHKQKKAICHISWNKETGECITSTKGNGIPVLEVIVIKSKIDAFKEKVDKKRFSSFTTG